MPRKKKAENYKIKKESRQLPCKLSAKDKAESAEELAEALQSLETLEIERKTETKNYNSQKQHLTAKVHRLSREITNSETIRAIECDLQLYYESLMVKVCRLDTKQIIEERPMTEEEKQMELDFDGDNKNEEI